jgi:septal ring factor EnvC (AmiA/AmiB activator)
MKYIFLLLPLIMSLKADQIQRIDTIANDIMKIKKEYIKCKSKLKNNTLLLKETTNKSRNLEKKIKVYKKLYEKEKEKNKHLMNKLNIYLRASKVTNKVKVYKLLKIIKNQRHQIKKILHKKKCKRIKTRTFRNFFPKLKMKKNR